MGVMVTVFQDNAKQYCQEKLTTTYASLTSVKAKRYSNKSTPLFYHRYHLEMDIASFGRY